MQRSHQRHKNYSKARGCARRYHRKQKRKATRQSKNRKPSTPPYQLSDNQIGQANLDEAIDPLSGLEIHASTSTKDKLARITALHAKWNLEDLETPLENEALETRQKGRCKKLGMIIFGFALRKAQIDAIWTLFYQKKDDLLLLARTGFGCNVVTRDQLTGPRSCRLDAE